MRPRWSSAGCAAMGWSPPTSPRRCWSGSRKTAGRPKRRPTTWRAFASVVYSTSDEPRASLSKLVIWRVNSASGGKKGERTVKPGMSLSLAVIFVSLLTFHSLASAQQPTTIRLGHVGFPGSLFAITTDEYAKRVNAELKGKVEIKVFHSSQLGSDEQMMRGIKVGAPEMFLPSTVMSTADEKFGVFEMPYIIVSRAHMKKVSENQQVQKLLFQGLPAKGIRDLGVWENGFRHITNNVRPVVKPEDLGGIKLRVPGGGWLVRRHIGT